MIYYFIGNNTYYIAVIFAKDDEEALKIYQEQVCDIEEDSKPVFAKYMFEKFLQENPIGLKEEMIAEIKEDIIDYRLGIPGFVSLIDSGLI